MIPKGPILFHIEHCMKLFHNQLHQLCHLWILRMKFPSNARLVRSCFRIMKSQLRFNICDLPSSFLLDSEVPDLKDRIRANIGDGLRYSCLHWAQHFAQTSSGNGRREIGDFLQLEVLFWIEAMNLLESRSQCAPMLQQARECILKVRILCYFVLGSR